MNPMRIVPRRTSAMLAPALVVAALGSTGPAFALEYPIGKPQIHAGMELSMVYLQPVSMEPPGMMRSVRDSDIHLEADLKAQSHNPNGFPDGTFVPYLDVHYEIAKEGSGQVLRGELMPMVANDGPHYGDNVKLLGVGKYHLRITVAAPGPGAHFGRHTDKETGVEPWFEPFTLDYEFAFTGLGKKGGY
jgi:periplasmic iron binding protein